MLKLMLWGDLTGSNDVKHEISATTELFVQYHVFKV